MVMAVSSPSAARAAELARSEASTAPPTERSGLFITDMNDEALSSGGSNQTRASPARVSRKSETWIALFGAFRPLRTPCSVRQSPRYPRSPLHDTPVYA